MKLLPASVSRTREQAADDQMIAVLPLDLEVVITLRFAGVVFTEIPPPDSGTTP